jgi:hypothetical protein
MVVVLGVLVADCSSLTGPTAALGQEFVLAPGERVLMSDVHLVVTFVGVEGDSRCPADAVCIQGGDAIVRIEARLPGSGPVRHALHTGDMQPVVHEGFVIFLVQLSPYPFSSRPILPDEYRATLRVTR